MTPPMPTSMRVDPLAPGAAKLEAIGGDEVRVNSASLDNPLVVLANQALKVLALDKPLHVRRTPRSAEFLQHRPQGFSEAGRGPSTVSVCGMSPVTCHKGECVGDHIGRAHASEPAAPAPGQPHSARRLSRSRSNTLEERRDRRLLQPDPRVTWRRVTENRELTNEPGSEHVARPVRATILDPARFDYVHATDTCIQCHSQGRPLKNPIEGKYYDWPVGFHVGLKLADWQLEEHKLGETTFTHFADGTAHKNRMQGNDFVTSLTYARGVTCFSCHDPHGTENPGMVREPGNALCLGCHGPNA
jgi:predicted CXXCH cytochrome family protein